MTETVCENEGTVSRNTPFTKLMSITFATGEIIALVNPDDDLDGEFKAFDIDENEWIRVKGWLAEINPMEDE